MTSGRSLPASFHPLRLVDTARELNGRLPLTGMNRLADSLVSPAGEVEVVLRFFRDQARRPVMKGHIETTLKVTCQRCMRPMDLPLRLDLALGIAESEQQAESLPEDLDPLIVDEEPLWLADLVEDELILGLSVVAMHPVDSPDCRGSGRAGAGKANAPTDVMDDAGGEDNPFAVLKALKQGKDNTDQH